MPWHILLECKAAQDHLQIMNHDSFGFDRVKNDSGRKQTCYTRSQCATSETSISKTLIIVIILEDVTNTNFPLISQKLLKRYSSSIFSTNTSPPAPPPHIKRYGWITEADHQRNVSEICFFQIP